MCPQPCNMKFGANNGNYLRQDTTVLQRLKFLLSEMCSLESKNVVTVTFWVKLTMPPSYLKRVIFFCCFFLCFVLYTLTWDWVWHLYNLVQWSHLVICFYIFISYLLYKKNWDGLYINFQLLLTYQNKVFMLQRTWIYYLTVSIGQESGHGLAGFSALDSQGHTQALAQACSNYRHNSFPYGVWLQSPFSC